MTFGTDNLALVNRRLSGKAPSLDRFWTPPWATRALIQKLRNRGLAMPSATVWEPCAGDGHMYRPLCEYFPRVYASDISPFIGGRSEPDEIKQIDFIKDPAPYHPDWIITNPPFNIAESIIEKARLLSFEGFAVLVRANFLEGVARYNAIYSRIPPNYVFQFVERVPMVAARCLRKQSTATAYAWLVWVQPHQMDRVKVVTTFDWIKSCRKELERFGDYDDDKAVH